MTATVSDAVSAASPAVSVVIPARNSAPTLGLQLGALALQVDAPPFEVIVADNGSSDDTADVVARWTALVPGLRLIDASQRPGPCAARNVGAEHAAAEKLLFCDADDAVQAHWVRAMSEALDHHVIVGGRMLDDALNTAEVRAWFPDLPRELFTKFAALMPYASGANLGIRHVALSAVGGWDESLTNATDADLCFRVQRELGAELGFVADATVQYRYRGDLRSLYTNMRGYGRSESALVERHGESGMRQRTAKAHVRSFGWLVVHLPDLVRGRSGRGRWVRRLGLTIGRVQGVLFGSATVRPGIDSAGEARETRHSDSGRLGEF